MSLSEINVDLFRMVNDLGKQYTYLNPAMSFIAEYMVFFLAFGVIVYWFTRRKQNRMMVICATIAFVIAEFMAEIAGKIHSNNQPFAELPHVNKLIGHAVDNSFPSDHTILFFAFCVTFLLFKKRFGFLWIALALCVGFSRIWVGVHYPGDVVVGATLSLLSAVIAYLVVPKLHLFEKLLRIYEKGERLILPTKKKSRDISR
ncbi:undecaprenyl-diphosphatase [Virgibacillus dakarensis]|nr:undecaprenyl-diphosphatase [Virgibacillus dakarensis]